jgi:hypothetical protein
MFNPLKYEDQMKLYLTFHIISDRRLTNFLLQFSELISVLKILRNS